MGPTPPPPVPWRMVKWWAPAMVKAICKKKHSKALEEIKECFSCRLEVRSIVLTPEIGKVIILFFTKLTFPKNFYLLVENEFGIIVFFSSKRVDHIHDHLERQFAKFDLESRAGSDTSWVKVFMMLISWFVLTRWSHVITRPIPPS